MPSALWTDRRGRDSLPSETSVWKKFPCRWRKSKKRLKLCFYAWLALFLETAVPDDKFKKKLILRMPDITGAEKEWNMNITCFDVADFFLASQDTEAEDYISNLKLQKLCYYAQGFCLAITGKPLFEDEIQAWAHGPVIPNLYKKYKDQQSRVIPMPEKSLAEISERFTKEQVGILEEVNTVYGQFSAWKLRDLTHQERPWLDAFDGGPCSTAVISQQSMKEYFKTQLVHE